MVDIKQAFKGESKDADFQLSASYPVQIRMLLAVTLTSKIKTSQMDELSVLRRLEPSRLLLKPFKVGREKQCPDTLLSRSLTFIKYSMTFRT